MSPTLLHELVCFFVVIFDSDTMMCSIIRQAAGLPPTEINCNRTSKSSSETMSTMNDGTSSRGKELEVKGNFHLLNSSVCDFLEHYVSICQPSRLHLCDGSDDENSLMCEMMKESGMIRPLTSKEYSNW